MSVLRTFIAKALFRRSLHVQTSPKCEKSGDEDLVLPNLYLYSKYV